MDNEKSEGKNKKKIKQKRCSNCNKKIGLIVFTCRCSETNIFCSNCRYPKLKETDEKGHLCDFDFKEFEQKILEKNNPKIESSKINNI
jgi:hypothetical protein